MASRRPRKLLNFNYIAFERLMELEVLGLKGSEYGVRSPDRRVSATAIAIATAADARRNGGAAHLQAGYCPYFSFPFPQTAAYSQEDARGRHSASLRA